MKNDSRTLTCSPELAGLVLPLKRKDLRQSDSQKSIPIAAESSPSIGQASEIMETSEALGGGQCHVVTGGFPCQPVSVGGEQRGVHDDRWKWPEMLAVIKGWKPIFVVAENVPGIISMELDNVLSDLEANGYTARPFVIPACAVNARHLRNRVWIVAYSESLLIKKQKVVQPARSVSQSRKHPVRLSDHLWRPDRKTYISDMVGEIYGVSEWAYRSKALGNAILPQIPQVFAREIKKALE